MFQHKKYKCLSCVARRVGHMHCHCGWWLYPFKILRPVPLCVWCDWPGHGGMLDLVMAPHWSSLSWHTLTSRKGHDILREFVYWTVYKASHRLSDKLCHNVQYSRSHIEINALFPLFSQSNVDQIGYPRTVLESACPKDFNVLPSCSIWWSFGLDI